MESGILNALFSDPVINRLTSGKVPSANKNLPEKLVARVMGLKGDAATLRWEGGQFSASLSARVVTGETLLLQYSGVKKGRSHYKIVARFSSEIDSSGSGTRDSSEPVLFGLMPGTYGKQGSNPALVRFLPEGKKSSEPGKEVKPLLELYLDTDNFGLVLVQFFFHKGDRLECRFVVETREAGQALQSEADNLIAESDETGQEKETDSLRWTVANLRQLTAEALHMSGINLNTQA